MSIQNFDKWVLNASDIKVKGYFDHTKLGHLTFKIGGEFYYKKIFYSKSKGVYINLKRQSYNIAEILHLHGKTF